MRWFVSPVLVFAWIAMLVAAPAGAKRPKKPKAPTISLPVAAVLPLGGVVPEGERQAVEALLRLRLQDRGYDVRAAAQTASLLDDVKALGLACDGGSIECLVRVGALDGASVILAGSIATDPTGRILELVAVDVQTVRERGRVVVALPADNNEQLKAIHAAVTGVLQPDAWRGTLRVSVAQRGASIYVDGIARGITPLSSSIVLSPGTHSLFVGLEGFRAHKDLVQVVFEQELALDITLQPGVSEAAPPPPSSLFGSAQPLSTPAPAAASPERRGPMRVVVYDIEAIDVAPRVARLMGMFLVAELRKRETISVLDSSELEAIVGGPKGEATDNRQCTEEQCFAEVAEALGADAVVVAQLTQSQGEIVFGVRRIDPKQQVVQGSFLARAPSSDDAALLPAIADSVDATFGELALRPGQQKGVPKTGASMLHPPPIPAVATGGVLAVAGVAALATLGASVVAATQFAYHGQRYEALAQPQAPVPTANAELSSIAAVAETSQLIALVSAGVLVVTGGAAALMWPWTDWNGYGASEESP
jgi:hypothetical protein